jgi:hypothetical protein
VLAFLDQVLQHDSRGPLVIITDSTQSRAGSPRLRRRRRPFHGSWLNQVEIWIGILTSKALKHRSFDSVQALARAILKFSTRWNKYTARPFECTYTGKVLAA